MPVEAGDFLISKPPAGRPWGSPSLLHNGYRVCSPEVKRSERDVERSPSSSAEVDTWHSFTSAYPLCLRGLYGSLPFLPKTLDTVLPHANFCCVILTIYVDYFPKNINLVVFGWFSVTNWNLVS